MHGERCNADLSLNFLPGLLGLGGVVDVKQRIVDPGERLSCIFIMAAGSENHVSENTGRKSCHRQIQIKNIYIYNKMIKTDLDDLIQNLLDQVAIQMTFYGYYKGYFKRNNASILEYYCVLP